MLVVKGALGAMGAGNTSVLMQLLVGMLDAALARQQDLVRAEERSGRRAEDRRGADGLNRGFAETMALKRSAGLETVACWQTDAQWTDREVRDQLDALFAHRVYFATASASDARAAVALTMAEFSDTVRPGVERLSSLGRPDVRLHLPKHHAVVSWATPEGRQPPFIARTIPLAVDPERIALHAARQHERGGRHRTDLRQPHWDRARARPELRRALRRAGLARRGESHRRARSAAPRRRAQLRRFRRPRELPGAGRLDGAHSVRWAGRRARSALELEPLDLEMLALIGALRHVLSSQIHRRFNPERAPRRPPSVGSSGSPMRGWSSASSSIAATVAGSPMCYADHRRRRERSRSTASDDRRRVALTRTGRAAAGAREHESRLRRARRDVHVAGWALALASAVAGRRGLRGPQAVLSP